MTEASPAEAPPDGRRRAFHRRIATAAPFVLSLGLSLATIGDTLHWQDSGFFLSAAKELGVLYPPGYVLYLVLARLWTLLFFFVDFTLAVHLFSAVCAASAAAVLGRAVAALLRSRGRLFRVTNEDPGPLADGVGAAIGCLAAAGYTFWYSGIYAKGYALFFLVLALLLRWMIRADESGRPRDFTVVAALIGLAWQAHPSATLGGIALLVFVGMHARGLGARGLAGRAALAAACAAGPILLLPLMAAGDPVSAFGDPRSPSDLVEYMTGRRFVAREDSFGWEPTRFASVGRYAVEEMRILGLLLAGAGLVVLARRNRRLLGWTLAWVVPWLEVTVLFRIEGQHDFWFVGAWLVLWLAAGAGLYEAVRSTGRLGAAAAAGVAAIGVAWAVAANLPDLNLRGYRLAELYGRAHLDALEDDAILLVHTDDAASGIHYLQLVKGVKPGVLLVRAGHLERGRTGEPSWYDRKLARLHPGLAMPDYAGARRRLPNASDLGLAAAAFVDANAGRGRPIYLAFRLPPEAVAEGHTLVPAGPLWKVVPRDAAGPVPWTPPVEPEEVRRQFRRERGQRPALIDHEARLIPEPYERRLLELLLSARRNEADRHHDERRWPEAVRLYESIAALDPEAGEDAAFLFRLGDSLCGAGEVERGERLLRRALEAGLYPGDRAAALVRRAELCRARGDEAGVARTIRDLEAIRPLPEDVRGRLERLRR